MPEFATFHQRTAQPPAHAQRPPRASKPTGTALGAGFGEYAGVNRDILSCADEALELRVTRLEARPSRVT